MSRDRDQRPGGRQPEKRMAVILFVDVVGSAELSNVLTYDEYDRFIRDFHEVAADVLRTQLLADTRYHVHDMPNYEASVRGDEMCVILYSKTAVGGADDAGPADVKTAVRLATEMKRKWLTSRRNSDRILDGKSIIDVAMGINRGYVMVGPHRRVLPSGQIDMDQISAEGYAINLAKRLEGQSRGGRYSRIFVSRSVYSTLRIDFQIAFDAVSMASLKGIAQSVPVYEIKSFGHVEDTAFSPNLTDAEVATYTAAVDLNPHDLWLILDLAHHHFDREDYVEAARKYRLALEVDPSFSPAHMYLGRSYYRDFQDDQALPHLQRARELNPDSARANNFLGVCLRRLASRRMYSNSVRKKATDPEIGSCYRRALEHHRTAMRIAEEDPARYRWAFNAYAMTLAQAVQADVIFVDSQADLAMDEALSHVEDVLRLDPQAQKNLFHHVRGFILGVQNHRRRARNEFSEAVRFLRQDGEVLPKKYREKMAEIEFHRGLLGLCGRTEAYRKAVCEAYVGDLLRGGKEENSADGEDLKRGEWRTRREFLERQYWYNHVCSELTSDQVGIAQVLTVCRECIQDGPQCGKAEGRGCVASQAAGRRPS